MFRGPSLTRLKRIGCGIVGLIALTFGLFYSRAGYNFSYRNWFGGLVFGPVAAILGGGGASGGGLQLAKNLGLTARKS